MIWLFSFLCFCSFEYRTHRHCFNQLIHSECYHQRHFYWAKTLEKEQFHLYFTNSMDACFVQRTLFVISTAQKQQKTLVKWVQFSESVQWWNRLSKIDFVFQMAKYLKPTFNYDIFSSFHTFTLLIIFWKFYVK